MEKKYLYFQPQYVSEFQCDGSRCNARCCSRNWSIRIDAETYEKYSRIKPPSKAQEIIALFEYDASKKDYAVKEYPCPLLTEEKLCRLQLEYGESFLSSTCATYPRYTRDLRVFFERSMTLTCPVAAELALFSNEPMKFELVAVSEEIHSIGGRAGLALTKIPKEFAERVLDVQIAMISILQERTLSIDQRLIVLIFFLDKLEEMSADAFDDAALTKLIAAYESKKFLTAQVPRMLASVSFDARKFIGLINNIFNDVYGGKNFKFIRMVSDALKIVPDERGRVALSKIAANYKRLASERKIFLNKYALLLESYLINDFFLNCYPWRFDESISTNGAIFITTYKIFELIMFAATLRGFDGKEDLLRIVDWFTIQSTHNGDLQQKIFNNIKDNILNLPDSLLEGSD